MKCLCKLFIPPAVVALALGVSAGTGDDDRIVKTYEGITAIDLQTVSGDCIVKKGNTDRVEVELEHSYSPRGSFEPTFRERGDVLKLTEVMRRSNSGSSTWVLTVPDDTRIEFSSASGNFTVENLTGDFSVGVASGDIDIRDCGGVFDLSTASGDVDVSNVSIAEPSSFSSASGSVRVKLADTPESDVSLGSASGRASLDYNGNPVKGYFEFVAKVRHGRIVSPFDFDDEETYRRRGDRDEYVRKSFSRGGDSPVIEIRTASGRATLRE
ncbi:MAG TPA: DUF4097 family beta strand repeat-containing protein [Acidobacteriota bacterium]|nr:DUF4097 family beta strand repeat-containing protein [Acidobacteriota bacterium]